MTHRPCGVCRAMVDAVAGCEHWNPAKVSEARRSQLAAAQLRYRDARKKVRKRERERVAAEVAELARVMSS